MPPGRLSRGFTLIELMIVVAIIGILSMVAIPKFADMVRKSHEGATKGNLAALRSAIQIYYGDTEGTYPTNSYSTNSSVLTNALVPTYINAIPISRASPYHDPSTKVYCHRSIWGTGTHQHDGWGWIYDGDKAYLDANLGKVWVGCTHTDKNGSNWTQY
ncbi:MAG: type II secretion system protein [Elusimicrobiota bacterium]